MTRRYLLRAAIAASVASGMSQAASAAGPDVVRIHGDSARTLLGDGTGVVIGVVDSGIDVMHPALTGTVTGGLPRFVASANFVTTEPANTGDDVFGHGTAVAGVIGSRDTTFFGVATDARFINARVLDNDNVFLTDAWVVNGTGFALANGANLLNLSLGYFDSDTSGNSALSLMCDYISYARRIPITVSAGNAGGGANPKPQGPGDAFNVFSAGATSWPAYDRVASFSSFGPTTGGRNKPDLVAPGDLINTASQIWEFGDDFTQWSGTSFAAPNIAGILAAQMEYGAAHGLSRDPLVLKATVLNSAEKVLDRNGVAWAPAASNTSAGVFNATSPLNRSAGAGQIDGLALASQYIAGEFAPGNVPAVGWDLGDITGVGAMVDYQLGSLEPGSTLASTLTWFRHVGWQDDGDGVLDDADSFNVLGALTNLNLQVFRDGVLVARSTSTVDNVEHLYLTNLVAGSYLLRVFMLSGTGSTEEFGLAWAGTAVPEPAAVAVALLIAPGALATRRRCRFVR